VAAGTDAAASFASLSLAWMALGQAFSLPPGAAYGELWARLVCSRGFLGGQRHPIGNCADGCEARGPCCGFA
jgi:hypothetical protein